MYKINFILESYNYGYYIELLDFISIISIFFGMLIITLNNPIHSILFLIGLFLSISLYLMLIGNNFIAFSYLLVYIGAVSILFLFILMLINIRISDILVNNKNSLSLAFIVSMFFYIIIYNIVYMNNFNTKSLYYYNIENNKNELDFVTSNLWDNCIMDISDIANIGNILYSNYFIWLIVTSIILLLAMVGCIAITIPTK